MTVTVLDSSNLVEYAQTGKVPVPAGIAEDNAAQAAKREAAKPEPKSAQVVESNKPEPVVAETPERPPADAPDDDEEGEDGLTPRQKREFTKSMLATIAKKHRAQKEAEELATSEYNRSRMAEERSARLEQELEAFKKAAKPAESTEGPPQRDKFETEEAYRDALLDYRVDQKWKEREAQQAKQQEEQEAAETLAHAKARIEHAIELVPDFKEVTEAVDMAVPPHIAVYMQGSDMFAELGYNFAKHPDVLARLAAYTEGLKPGTQKFVDGITRSLVELGKIESRLTPFASPAKVDDHSNGAEPSQTNGTKPSTETGSAPSKPRVQAPIIRPLSAGSGAQVEKDPSERTAAEDLIAWQRKHNVKLTARKRH
jgi:hypothetical protein